MMENEDDTVFHGLARVNSHLFQAISGTVESCFHLPDYNIRI